MLTVERVLAGREGLPSHRVVGIESPQTAVVTKMCGLGEAFDVARNAVIVSLRPLVIAVAFERERVTDASIRVAQPWFEYSEVDRNGSPLGTITLKPSGVVHLQRHVLYLFSATGFDLPIVDPLQRRRHYLAEWWKFKRRPDPHNFYMEPRDLFAQLVFYTCPRPVVLVTTVFEDSRNIFPMDLIGPTDSPYFLLALRTTNRANWLMTKSKKIVMSDIPIDFTDIAYELGGHHSKLGIDWDALPFATVPSQLYGFPTPSDALKVSELHVARSVVIGSHRLYITEIERVERRVSARQMHHIQGYYAQYLDQQGRRL